MSVVDECRFEFCTKRTYAKKLCTGHYNQDRKGVTLHPLRTSPEWAEWYKSRCQQPCAFDSCGHQIGKPRYTGLCKGHHRQYLNGEDLRPLATSSVAKEATALRHENDCSFDSCTNPVQAKGLCQGHYAQQRQGKELCILRDSEEARAQRAARICSRTGCTNRIRSKLLCKTHYLEQLPSYSERQYRSYNITRQQYDDLLRQQNGCCAICGSSEPKGTGAWHIDHDHTCCPSKKKSCGACVRGLLCSNCNCALGLFKDDPKHLQEALAYLSR